MDVILLERIGSLGQMGDVVKVKDGYARNFLLPKGKALRATKDNKTKFESMKAELIARNLALKGEADKLLPKLKDKSIAVIRQASETGQLYGSVTTRDVASMLNADGIDVNRSQIVMNAPIKTIGQFKVPVALHPEVEITVTVNVARSMDEAERLARGEDISVLREQTDEEAAAEEAEQAAEDLFDPEVAEKRRQSGDDATAEPAADAEKPAKAKGKKKSADAAAE